MPAGPWASRAEGSEPGSGQRRSGVLGVGSEPQRLGGRGAVPPALSGMLPTPNPPSTAPAAPSSG